MFNLQSGFISFYVKVVFTNHIISKIKSCAFGDLDDYANVRKGK